MTMQRVLQISTVTLRRVSTVLLHLIHTTMNIHMQVSLVISVAKTTSTSADENHQQELPTQQGNTDSSAVHDIMASVL